MGRTWGRLYAGTRNHRKIRILRQRHPTMWFAWYVLIELAIECDDEGWIYVAPDRPYTWKELAQETGTGRSDNAERFVRTLIDLGLASYTEGKGIRLTSFSERNYESDCSTARVQKYRERKKTDGADETFQERSGNVSVTDQSRDRTEQNKVHSIECVAASAFPDDETPLPCHEDSENVKTAVGPEPDLPSAETETEHEPENSKKTQQVKKSTDLPPKITPANLMALWNELGCRPLVIKLTDVRRKKAMIRIRQRDDPAWWRELLEKIRGLQAKGRPWLTFDFLIGRENNLLKIVEGNYDDDFPKGKKHNIAENHQQRSEAEHYYRVRPVEPVQPAGC